MPELRQNVATREWVIIATERAKRPDQFVDATRSLTESRPPYDPACPFCPGNEEQTPPEVDAVRPNLTEANEPGWLVRIVPNRHVAQDVCQDVFFAAWRNLPTLQDRDAFGGWLLRIARNNWIDAEYRRRLINEAKECLRRF